MTTRKAGRRSPSPAAVPLIILGDPVNTNPDRDTLRQRIAAAIWERQNPGRRYADCEYRWQADAEADADAVLAVLPDPTDRAAILTEGADAVAKLDRRTLGIDADTIKDAWEEGRDAGVEELRRLAAEAPLEPCGRPVSMLGPCSAGDHCCKGPTAAEAPTTTKPETDLVEEYLWFLRGLGSEPDLSSLPPERRKVVTAQFEIIRTLADRDPELPPIERDPVARRLGLTGASEPAAGVGQDGAQPS